MLTPLKIDSIYVIFQQIDNQYSTFNNDLSVNQWPTHTLFNDLRRKTIGNISTLKTDSNNLAHYAYNHIQMKH